ncbi:ATP-binding protein [uncultured Selenomonas sp.]|uniref:AAA family ATPase n=1 Tax=uncultured Selenomonas sp. TaxID=159275 RepID=UPI0025D2370B|nr:ATP-binding protein [uncultured Selenomonas sp.]
MKNRLISEIEKQRQQGRIFHFLTGDGVNDNFYYDLYHGVLSAADTLMTYYLVDHPSYDFFLHVENANNNLHCYRRNGNTMELIAFEDMFPPPVADTTLPRRRRRTTAKPAPEPKQEENVQAAATEARSAASTITARIERLTGMLKHNEGRVLLFLENLEWIANLYGDSDTTWIATLKRWEKQRNLLMVATIKDMELIKKYAFDEPAIFLPYPSAEEIRLAYLRHVLRAAKPAYKLQLAVLSDIAHAMSVGKKSLCACMRVLRGVLRKNPDALAAADFEEGVTRMIEERITWEQVRLDQKLKDDIRGAIDIFLRGDEKRPARKGLLFAGPPGTGKTLIAKALASETKCYFMAPTLADLKGEYIGQSSAKIKRVFAEARANAPTILFIDEADTVFPSRSLGAGDRDSYSLDMVNQFLQELDGAYTGKQKIFTIAATNRPEAVDGAIKSRLSNEPVTIPLPSKQLRRMIFDDNLAEGGHAFSLKGKLFEDEVLRRSENMSGRDIMNFVKQLKEAKQELRNDEATAELFRTVFRNKERAFRNELMSLGIFSQGNILAPRENPLRLDDVIGYEDLKEKIHLQVRYILSSEAQKNRYAAYGIEPQKGVLLYGPPGNGKSMLAKAVAGQYDFYFFKVLSRDFANSYPEEQIKKLERIFTDVTRFSKMMTDAKGIVLFFDEFDSLAGTHVLNPVVRGSLLNYIADENGLRSKNSKILLMAATNYEGSIDEAIKRQGRIDTHLFMDHPSEEDGIRMLERFLLSGKNHDKIVLPERGLLKEAYQSLHNERALALKNKWNKLLATEDASLQPMKRKERDRWIRAEARPSGAALQMLAKELKEFAFWKLAGGETLVVDETVLRERFHSAAAPESATESEEEGA